ncbi:hypothetical protein DOS83_05680 [Staphylococcus felis]|uniref:Uncharacterized protein n=1 Tax=Staphylococcus felis TaxID=46127 RepID=A0A3E0IQ43_9STAP|nr:hypothetical protein DOS61_09010 [Staphylococcus felis]REH96264.1 hypothetical protein DOS83_05680 [Staphylococcus felis]
MRLTTRIETKDMLFVACLFVYSKLTSLLNNKRGVITNDAFFYRKYRSLERGWDIGFQFPRKTPQKSFEMIFVVFFI